MREEMKVRSKFWVIPGTSSKITEQNLKATDIDSDNLRLRYILTKDPPSGKIQLSRKGGMEKVSVKGPVQSFTQDDVNKGAGLVRTVRTLLRQLTNPSFLDLRTNKLSRSCSKQTFFMVWFY